jgi:peptidoglycan/xylan/chitin deacetylase (PgdA/CDA1 family)
VSDELLRPADAITWPDGRSAAASFTFDVDAESAALSVSWDLAGRQSVMSHQAYGPLTGLPRILSILERHGVRSTFFVPGWTAERHPAAIRDIVAAGHEIAHHGYLHESPLGRTTAEQAEFIDRGLDALDRVAGVRPVGYRAPLWELTYDAPALLADRGFLYESSLMDADVPYELAVDADRSLVEIPIFWGLDDWEQYAFVPGMYETGVIESPRKVEEVWRAEYDGLVAAGGCFVLTNHPFLSGRPGRAMVLDRLVADAVDDDRVWVASMEEIARYVRAQDLRSRAVTRPLQDGE